MGFTFDSPISLSSAYDQTHRRRSAHTVVTSLKPRQKSITSSTASDSIFAGLRTRIRSHTHRSASISSSPASKSQPSPPTATVDSLLFRLPLVLRQKIYGYVVGQNEVLHILLKRRAYPLPYSIAYRRCRASSYNSGCVESRCREFLEISSGTYFGSFDRVGGLLLTSRDIAKEASMVLYERNKMDFDHPLSLILFGSQISGAALHSIRSVSFEAQRHHCVQKYNSSRNYKNMLGNTCFQQDLWVQMWEVVADMQGLEEIRVRLHAPLLGWNEEEILAPLWKVTKPLSVFDVEAPWITSEVGSETEWMEKGRPFRLLGSS